MLKNSQVLPEIETKCVDSADVGGYTHVPHIKHSKRSKFLKIRNSDGTAGLLE